MPNYYYTDPRRVRREPRGGTDDYCVICGEYIGECGSQVCEECRKRIMEGKDDG